MAEAEDSNNSAAKLPVLQRKFIKNVPTEISVGSKVGCGDKDMNGATLKVARYRKHF